MSTVAHQHTEPSFLSAYIITMRPYLLFVSGITGIAGISFGSGLTTSSVMLLSGASFFSYGFGQALTDCFQMDTDRLSSPYRPLVRGSISRSAVLGVSVLGLLSCITVFAVFSPWNLLLGLAAGTGLATYTFFKRRWWGGPWYNAWIVGVLFLMGYLGGGGSMAEAPPPLLWALAAVVCGYCNFVLSGYFKDITADSHTGYLTLPVVFGRRTAARISDILAALTLYSLVETVRMTSPDGLQHFPATMAGLFLIAAIIAGTVAQFMLHRVTRDDRAHLPVSLVVHAYLLGLSAIAVAQQPGWGIPLLVFYGTFVLVLWRRPSRSQI